MIIGRPTAGPTRPANPESSVFGDLARIDEELHRLARGGGRLRLRVGQALHRLGDAYRDLGFSTLGAYALERCNRTGRWAAESRALARRLESLPCLSAALESGSVGWSMAELLARHATPATEAALITIASGETVQSMRLAFARSAPHQSFDEPDGEELSRTLSLTVAVEEAWALEATRMMIEHMDGGSSGEHWLAALLAEGYTSLLDLIGAGGDGFCEPMEREQAAWRAEVERQQLQQAEVEQRRRPAVPREAIAGEAPSVDDFPTGLHALDDFLRQLSAALASRDLFFGRMAERFLLRRGWQSLGFATEAHYARDRLGMSRASLRAKVSLARRTRGMEHVVDALQHGRIGFEAAQLVARIATPATEEAWVTRATLRTFKHLREEVQAVELAARFLNSTDRAPPTRDRLDEMQALERAVLSGELLKGVARDCTAFDCGDATEDEAVQISGTPPADVEANPCAKATLRFRIPGDLLLHYRQLERIHRQKLPNTSFIQFLCANFWRTWIPMLGISDRWEQIYRRDRYRCTSPVCHQRNVTLHHVRYRANGGTDEPNNLTSPCAFCHLEGEHGGRLQILPPGSDPTWLLGRRPIIRVHRRERALLS